jgi:hypothetical protein
MKPIVAHLIRKSTQVKAPFINNQITTHQTRFPYLGIDLVELIYQTTFAGRFANLFPLNIIGYKPSASLQDGLFKFFEL